MAKAVITITDIEDSKEVDFEFLVEDLVGDSNIADTPAKAMCWQIKEFLKDQYGMED